MEERTATSIDFARSYCWYVPQGHSIWVRIQVECVCDVIDESTGVIDRYVLGVRTQTGLRTDPPSDHLDPGYDFWMTFSNEFVYVKRNHASSRTNNPTRVPAEEFIETGWHLEAVPARYLTTPAEIHASLRAGERLTARTTFRGESSETICRIEYPIKWSDGDPIRNAYRVETGPVLLLDPDSVKPGVPVAFDDFTWSYLDYHDGDSVRCLMERPTSILTGSTYATSPETPHIAGALTIEEREALERFLFQHPDRPVGDDVMRSLLSTMHYSDVSVRPAETELFVIEGKSR